MKKVKLLVLLVMLIGLVECDAIAFKHQRLPIETMRDDFEGLTWVFMSGNVLESEEDYGAIKVMLDPQQFTCEDGRIGYNLVLEYLGNDWLFIDRPLIFLIDGRRMRLEGIGQPFREVIEGAFLVREIQNYSITPEQFRRIAFADWVRVRVSGDPYSLDKRFTEENLLNYRHFYKEVVE